MMRMMMIYIIDYDIISIVCVLHRYNKFPLC